MPSACARSPRSSSALGRVALVGAGTAAARPIRPGRASNMSAGCASTRMRCAPQNAYYSPDKVALAVRLFPGAIDAGRHHRAGLDGVRLPLRRHRRARDDARAARRLYPRLSRALQSRCRRVPRGRSPTSIALFQHFGYRDLVRREIAGGARQASPPPACSAGSPSSSARGPRAAARCAITARRRRGSTIRRRFEVHDRGQLLVSAIYEAFLAIVERRTGDLIRLATGGSGVLPGGAIHPDLVERLTRANRAHRRPCAAHVHPRARLLPADRHQLRRLSARADHRRSRQCRPRTISATAPPSSEAFRRRDLLPTNLRTVSIETLRWRRPREPSPGWLAPSGGGARDRLDERPAARS